METWASDNDEAVRQECLTVEEALSSVSNFNVGTCFKARAALAAEVRRLRALVAEHSDTVEHGGVAVYRLLGDNKEERVNAQGLLIEFNARGDKLERVDVLANRWRGYGISDMEETQRRMYADLAALLDRALKAE